MASFIPATQTAYDTVIRDAWQSRDLYWSLLGTLAYLSCLFLATRAALERPPHARSLVLARDTFVVGSAILFSTIPLFVVGADYGRWLSTASVTTVLLLTNAEVMTAAATWMRRALPTMDAERGSAREGGATVAVRALLVGAALLTPFLFLPHDPPSFVVLRTISARTLRLDDFGAFVTALFSL
jgi:hypothetical protein